MSSLYTHFQREEIPDGIWIDEWLLTLFLYNCPLGLGVRVWDCLLAEGVVFLVKMGLAILKLHQKELLRLDLVGVLNYLR